MSRVYSREERAAFVAGAKKAENDRDMTALERIAKSLELIVEMMQKDRENGQ